MSNKCDNCRLTNFPTASACARCGAGLERRGRLNRRSKIAARIGVCATVLVAVLLGFYLSLIGSAKKLSIDEKHTVRKAIAVISDRGFSDQAILLNSITAYRASDNWLNASVPKESAYAATNFPFEIMTLYPEFFTYPVDDTERAAILLHEARHLAGRNEHDAYEFVWKNRRQLGWTRDVYSSSVVWQNVRKQTRDNVPELFVCEGNEFSDCTETPN